MEERLSPEQRDQILEELKAGNKIGAIKLYREFTGKGLKESKEFVEGHIKNLIERDAEKYGYLVSKGGWGCSTAVVFFIGLATGLIYWVVY